MLRCKHGIIVLVKDCRAILVRLDRSGQIIECAPVFFGRQDRNRIGFILYCNFLCHRQDFPALGFDRTILVQYILLGHSKGDLVGCAAIGRSDLQLILVCQTFPCLLAVVYGVPFHCKAGNIRLCACGRPWRHTVSAEQLQGCLGIYSCKGVLVCLRCIQLDLGQLHLGGCYAQAVCDIVVPVGAGGCAVGRHAAQGGQQPVTGILRLHGKAFIAKRKRCAARCRFCLRTAVHPAFRQQAQHAAGVGRVGQHFMQRVRQGCQTSGLCIGRILLLIAVRQLSNLLVIRAIFKEIAHVVVAAVVGILNRQRQLLPGQELGLARRRVA